MPKREKCKKSRETVRTTTLRYAHLILPFLLFSPYEPSGAPSSPIIENEQSKIAFPIVRVSRTRRKTDVLEEKRGPAVCTSPRTRQRASISEEKKNRPVRTSTIKHKNTDVSEEEEIKPWKLDKRKRQKVDKGKGRMVELHPIPEIHGPVPSGYYSSPSSGRCLPKNAAFLSRTVP
ncbi:hypothetical protein BC939DRAFT_479168 [Gamsiella multidivaricata]|uniref:uncharacterized protein n=1 Tax=Gamsiella multidivaricata TaxID=101098 RepID=UPI0022208BD3|nr:uncharacterized protein BC939DRAFT_479168 [Gamsiella multidivaricata]KAI7820018.1 hypothetical protein BC939DRAFT_479168 [Gamsiella multidivaricata]